MNCLNDTECMQGVFGGFFSLLFLMFMALVIFICIYQFLQERAEKNIERFKGSYRAMCKGFGLTFQIYSESGDPTPGIDTIIHFEGPTVNAKLTPTQALSFFKSLQKGTPNITFLEGKSRWAFCPLP